MRTGHPAAQHLSLDDPLGGGPIDDACMLELARQPQPPSARLHVTSWASKLLNAKNDSASRPSVVRADAQVRPLTRPLAPSSRPKLALFFRSVSTFEYCFRLRLRRMRVVSVLRACPLENTQGEQEKTGDTYGPRLAQSLCASVAGQIAT